MGERTWLAGLRQLRTTRTTTDTGRGPARAPVAGLPGAGKPATGHDPRRRAVQPADLLEPVARPVSPPRCRSTATHLHVDGAHGSLTLHLRPDAGVWRPIASGAPLDALAALHFGHSEVPGTIGSSLTTTLTVAVHPRAATLVERQRRLGLPAGPAALVQGDRIAYTGLGPCTRVMRFSGGPGVASLDLSGTLHLLWRLGPRLDLLLTLVTERAEQLFAVLPDVDAFADRIELCAIGTRGETAAPLLSTVVPPRSAFAT